MKVHVTQYEWWPVTVYKEYDPRLEKYIKYVDISDSIIEEYDEAKYRFYDAASALEEAYKKALEKNHQSGNFPA